MKIEINPEFVRAFKLIDKGANVFITGRAGTGKSTLLEYFRSHTDKNVVVLAPTGVAAVNVGGQTIHSFFAFKPDITVEKVTKNYKNRSKGGLYKKIEAIIIDEVSMVRADLLDCVDTFLRLNGKDKTKPFGGIKMIFIGDLYQLPPVTSGQEGKIFKEHYETPYFFSARALKGLDLEIVELEKIYRQKDQKFIDILNAVRNRSINETMLEALNQKVDVDFESPSEEFYIYLTTTNAKASLINQQYLAKLLDRAFIYEGIVSGEFDLRSLPTDIELSLKAGAQVMLVNNDRRGRWINGTIGKVVKIKKDDDGDVVLVELTGKEVVEVLPHTWEMFKFVYNAQSRKIETEIVGTFTQYPIILAWAITIHKSQGKTFEKVIVDMDRGAFAHGQTYVALSRCVSLDGLVLKKAIEKKHILLDWKVVKFLTEFRYRKAELEMGTSDKVGFIKQAIENSHRLEITYLKSNDVKTKRVIKPNEVGTMEYLDKKFLGVLGFDFLRGEERVFRVDRILELKVVEKE